MFRSRYRRILWFFARVFLNVILWDIILYRLGFRRWARRTRPERLRRTAQSFRSLAVEMGGVMIKVGQFLSARLDVLPRQITDTLAGLQDEVQAERFEDIRKVVEAELNAPLDEKFCQFDEVPVASASIGQVHCACLTQPETGGDGKNFPPVVVKVQRPNIEAIVEVDLAALRVVGGWLMRYPPVRKHANVPRLIAEFSQSLYEEIDYLHEGKNAETFAQNFQGRPEVRVPRVYWPYTTRRVLVLEDVQAIKITDYTAIEAAGIDRAEVADRLLDTYLKQIFEDHFFHADPHPGNLFILPLPGDGEQQKKPWQLVFVDFGMTGRLPQKTLEGMRELLVASVTRDAARVVHGYQLLDVLLPGADLELLERANERAFQKLWGKSISDMRNMRHEEALEFAHEFEGLIYEMPFQFPTDMVLLGRCLSILNGICTGLNPEFNVWLSVTPYANHLLESERNDWLQTFLAEVGELFRILVALPRKADRLLTRIEQGHLEVHSREIQNQIARLERTQRSLVGAILFSAFLVAGTQVYLADHLVLAAALGLAALLSLGWMLFRRR